MELTLSALAVHLMRHLRAVRVNVSVGVQARRHIVGVITHFLHDVDLAVGGPRLEVYRHHPECRPGATTLRQLDACLDVAIFPALFHLGVDTARINLAVLFQTGDAQGAVFHLGDAFAAGSEVVHVVLKFVIHPA